MNINDHELTTKDMFHINMLKEHIESPKLLDFIWVKKYQKELKIRLEKLEKDFDDGHISDKAYKIWKGMIEDVIKD
jgi:lysophospholipase L1-like esterase